MILSIRNEIEDFQVELASGSLENEEGFFINISKLSESQEFETAFFSKLEVAKEVYFSFINWSIKGMHTFKQRAMLLKELEKYYNKTKINARNEK